MKAASVVHLPATSLTVVTVEALHHCFRPARPEVVLRHKAEHAVIPHIAEAADVLAGQHDQLDPLTRFLLGWPPGAGPCVRIEATHSRREASDG